MATAISLASESCSDVPRWYSAAVVVTVANVPVALGYSCVTDLCIQHLFEEEYTALVLGTDYTADLDAGTVTFLTELEGTAIAYFNVIVCATEEECKTAPCCPPDPYDYQSINGTDSGTETNEGCEEVEVTVEPVSGSYVFFPSYIVLSADHDDAVIRYTTDGSDPDEFSTLYEGPFLVESSGTVIKARATVGDCAAGAITTIFYQNPTFPVGFVYACDTPDHGGTWDVWVPNSTVDNHWQIEFELAAQTEVKRLELYQLDTDGNPTGIQWSTDSVPNPTLDDLHNPASWLKADAIPALTDGAAIASWPDSSGNGNDATQATGSKQPLYKTAIVNSKPVVRFDGTDDELICPMSAGATKTIMFVVKKRGAISATAQAVYGIAAIQQLFTSTVFSAAGWVYWEDGTDLGGDPTNWGVVTFKYESLAVLKIYLNETLVATADPNNGFATEVSFSIGSNGMAAAFGDYDVAEVLVYDTALTDTERLDVYAYLEAKYFDAAPTYTTWPLLVFESATQQWSAYQNTLGLFPAGTHTLDLYGDQQFPVSGFFRLEMVLGDDSRLISTINDTCTADPPVPCPSPAAPVAVGLCDGIVEVTFVGTAGQNYKVFVSEVGSPGGWTLLLNDTIPSSPHTYEAFGLTPGELYYFRVELEYAGCGYQSSIPVSAVPLPDPEVTIATDKTIVDPSESFTISWTSTNIGGAACGSCPDGQVTINQSLGCKAGNAAGSQATSQVTPGIYTYTITGCNTCGTVVASVQVEVRDVAVCGEDQPTIITLENPTTFLCGVASSGCFTPLGGGTIAWNGDMVLDETCRWALVGTNVWGGCETVLGIQFPLIGAGVAFEGGVWVLSIAMFGTYWTGTKASGSTPLGTYTRTSGCMTGPATLTIT